MGTIAFPSALQARLPPTVSDLKVRVHSWLIIIYDNLWFYLWSFVFKKQKDYI